jgi:hypothetical protein
LLRSYRSLRTAMLPLNRGLLRRQSREDRRERLVISTAA